MTKGKGTKPKELIPPAPAAHKATQQEFVEAYQALCKRMGWQIGGQSVLRPMNDLGGSIIVAQLGIVPFVEQPPQQ
jgi:hypothetical protein